MWKLPIIGWCLSATAAVSLSIPFWLCWTVGGIGRTYFYWLPPVYQAIPFWSCVGLSICLTIAGCFVPKLAWVSNNNTVKTDD